MERSLDSSEAKEISTNDLVCDSQHFSKIVREVEGGTPLTSRNRGLDMFPDEVLAEVLLLAAALLEEKVSLSLVCKRFRIIMMSFRRLWEEYKLRSSQTPEQALAIAEGQRFRSMKASISQEGGKDYLNASSEVMISLRSNIVELELHFFDLGEGWAEEVQRSLEESKWPVLQTLKLATIERVLYLKKFLGGVDMPSPWDTVTNIYSALSTYSAQVALRGWNWKS